jgi:thymidylate synthase
MNKTNEVWKQKVQEIAENPQHIVSPRGMEVKENLAEQYTVPMPAYIDLAARKVNVPFMLAEAAWIASGSNRLSDLTPTMKRYADFSDDGIFLRGAYGPKVIDQLGYVVDTLEKDKDSRQAVLNIWRERPGESKDIPCTTNMQFIIRDDKLNMVTTMRSHDIVLGYTYDVFSFSMVAKSVQLLLKERGVNVELGDLTVTAGSMHLYETHYEKYKEWVSSDERNESIKNVVDFIMSNSETYEELIKNLKEQSE